MKKILIIAAVICSYYGSFAQQTQIDDRLRLHYSPEDIKTIQKEDPAKIPVLNFYYRNSYVIVKPKGNRASKIDLSAFDVTPYESQRQGEVRTAIKLPKYNCTIELLSLRELEEAYKKLRNP